MSPDIFKPHVNNTDDDDDFQTPLFSQTQLSRKPKPKFISPKPLNPINSSSHSRPPKKPKRFNTIPGKENRITISSNTENFVSGGSSSVSVKISSGKTEFPLSNSMIDEKVSIPSLLNGDSSVSNISSSKIVKGNSGKIESCKTNSIIDKENLIPSLLNGGNSVSNSSSLEPVKKINGEIGSCRSNSVQIEKSPIANFSDGENFVSNSTSLQLIKENDRDRPSGENSRTIESCRCTIVGKANCGSDSENCGNFVSNGSRSIFGKEYDRHDLEKNAKFESCGSSSNFCEGNARSMLVDSEADLCNMLSWDCSSNSQHNSSSYSLGKQNAGQDFGYCDMSMSSCSNLNPEKVNDSLMPLDREKSTSCFSSSGLEKAAVERLSDVSRGFGLDDLQSADICGLDLIKSSIDCTYLSDEGDSGDGFGGKDHTKRELEMKGGYLCNSIESRLTRSKEHLGFGIAGGGMVSGDEMYDEFENCDELNALIKLCSETEPGNFNAEIGLEEGSDLPLENDLVCCPLCGADISDLSDELRQEHTNDCLDEAEDQNNGVLLPNAGAELSLSPKKAGGPSVPSPGQVIDFSPVQGWLRSLGLERYEEAFIREEIDWDNLQWMTNEDLLNIGITALGPRKKIMHALNELRKGHSKQVEDSIDESENRQDIQGLVSESNVTKSMTPENNKITANKRITDYFPGCVIGKISSGEKRVEKQPASICKSSKVKKNTSDKADKTRRTSNRKFKEVPAWCCIPGTPFRVDAFRYLRRDCSHWFLTHFHMDHYQGLTRSFCHGKVYCSEITAKLVNMKIGISWDKLQVLPLNQKITIAGVDVTCLDANHCPGSIIILFEPPNGEAVLHTGDFRFCEETTKMHVLQDCRIHTLILDTTYCNPQYDFPQQEEVIQFVIEAIQAESFNPKTLFLIGSYTIGKERLYLEVARVLRKMVYVGAAKLCVLQCLGFPNEDMQWLTTNEQESHIHVVPMWALASFKRLKHISNQYRERFSLIVAFSPSGWSFDKGKKKSKGRRWQQGTIIRYEVPYSEHCSFSELKEFVKFISPVNLIPSVNNDGPDSANAMISLLSF